MCTNIKSHTRLQSREAGRNAVPGWLRLASPHHLADGALNKKGPVIGLCRVMRAISSRCT